MAIGVARFGGIRPAVSARSLISSQSTVAHNMRLGDATLRPERTPQLVREDTVDIGAIYVPATGDCCPDVMTFPKCVSVTEPADPGACCGFDHVIVWDNCNGYHRQDRCGTQTYPLVVPAPTKTLTVTLTAQSTTTQADARSYTYTWVDRFGVESQPAPPTLPIQAADGSVYVLGNFDAPPANAVAVRVYRTSSEFEGFKQSNADTNPVGTTFQLVEEVALPLAGGKYTDTRRLKDIEFGTLSTHEGCPPPSCMVQVVLTEQGYHVGFNGNELYVSERNEPANWPTRYSVTLPDKIVGIVAVGDTVMIATAGTPYRVTPRFHPDRDQADAVVDPVALRGNFPCLQRETLVATEFGAVYAALQGLVAIHATGPDVARIATEDHIGRAAWAPMIPNIGAWYNGAYYGVRAPSGKAFRFEFPTAKDRAPEITTLDMDAHAIHAGRDGWLYYAKGKQLFRWTAGNGHLTYRWRSKAFHTWSRQALGAARVFGDFGSPVEFRLLSAGTLIYSRSVNSSSPFRLPAAAGGYEFQIEIVGTTRIHAVIAATTIRELSDVERSARGEA